MREVTAHFDVRRYKQELRERFKRVRAQIPPELRAEKDEKITKRVLSLPEYKSCGTLLCYVSFGTETDTRSLIGQAVKDGKNVAVPCCVDGTRYMNFYKISSFSQLKPGTFGVLEPDPDDANLVTDFSNSICVLPGIAFDLAGFRLGYGGGYYDRFLSRHYNFEGKKTVGICYSECAMTSIRHGRYDVGCDILVTDLFLKRIKNLYS